MKRMERISGWAATALLLVLLTLSAWYGFANLQRDHRVTGALGEATQRLERLARRDPYPTLENIRAVRSETKRLRNVLARVKTHFEPSPAPVVRSDMDFRSYLDTTVAKLRTGAHTAGVQLPTDYWFTFGAQKGTMAFSPGALPPLAAQLSDIALLCETLFEAKVNALLWLKRVPVASQDAPGSQDYLDAKPVTNTWTVLMPYEVAFQGFSSELARVLNRLAALPQSFVVANVAVEPVSETAVEMNWATPAWPSQEQRRWRSHESWRPPVARPFALGPGSRTTTTVLTEKPRRFILTIQAVRSRSAGAQLAAN